MYLTLILSTFTAVSLTKKYHKHILPAAVQLTAALQHTNIPLVNFIAEYSHDALSDIMGFESENFDNSIYLTNNNFAPPITAFTPLNINNENTFSSDDLFMILSTAECAAIQYYNDEIHSLVSAHSVECSMNPLVSIICIQSLALETTVKIVDGTETVLKDIVNTFHLMYNNATTTEMNLSGNSHNNLNPEQHQDL